MAFDASHAVLMAARYCKQYPLFQWREEALPEIGRRRDKFSFLVDLTNLRQERGGDAMLMTLFPVGLSFLDFQKESTLYKLKALFVTIKHPYVLPIVDFYFSKEKKGLLVVQPFLPTGSLKDRIHRSCPTRPYREKYRMYHASPLPYREIARFGRQLLEALQALRSKGIMCEHLHAGNVVIDQGNARIADIYTPLLAMDRHKEQRETTVGLESRVDIDVLLFGHLLYEMATGMELFSTTPDESVLDLMVDEVADVLRAIFFPRRRQATSSSRAMAEQLGEDENDGDGVGSDSSDIASRSSSSGDGSSSSSGTKGSEPQQVAFLTDVRELLRMDLFIHADVVPIETLFAGFRFDSGMKATVRHSMRINASRNYAHVVQHRDKEALIRARQRAERRVLDEKEKHERRALEVKASRAQLTRSASTSQSKTGPTRRTSYRAHSFKNPLDRPTRESEATSSA
ncbi:hypothetical protein ATCC90586_009365 [Pythium insidiosum]|nr:hypothetical protein ATCC90586_009365 [Pythium insidiosum]